MRTLNEILKYIDIRKSGKNERKSKLIGMPGYEMLLNEVEA